jgi:hypothetical protein
MSSAVPNLDRVVREIADEMAQRLDRGKVATYIRDFQRTAQQCTRASVDQAREWSMMLAYSGREGTTRCC